MTLIAVILLYMFLVHVDVALGQNETHEATVTEGFLYSPGYDSGTYDNNMTFDYRVYTNYLNHTVRLEVVDCDIETDKNGDCLYDILTIYDGFNDSATPLDEFCCADPSNPPSWTGTGPEIYLLFETDTSKGGRGFKISFVSDGPTTTTSTTSTTTSTTSTTTTSTSTTTTTTTTSTTTPTTTTTTSTTSSTTTTQPPTTTTEPPTTVASTTAAVTTAPQSANSSTSSTSSTTTTQPPTTTTEPPTTTVAPTIATALQAAKSSSGNNNQMIYIIAGVCAGVVLIIIIVIIIICLILKSKNRPVEPVDSKSSIWQIRVQSRPSISKPPIPPKFPDPPGHIETKLFDMDLPEGRGNLLPPLSSQMDGESVKS